MMATGGFVINPNATQQVQPVATQPIPSPSTTVVQQTGIDLNSILQIVMVVMLISVIFGLFGKTELFT